MRSSIHILFARATAIFCLLVLMGGLCAQEKANALCSEDFISHFGKLDNIAYRIHAEKKATVAFLGGSITNMNGWRDLVMQYLKEKFPATDFTFINAGIPSLGSLAHVFRMQQDVLDKGRIDLLFVEAAVNDKANATPEQQQRRALEGIIRHAFRANPQMSLVVMAFADEFKNADYDAGIVPAEVQVHEDLARHYKIPFINLAKEVDKRIANHEFTWKDDFRNLHPSPFGHQLYSHTIEQLLDDGLAIAPASLTSYHLPAPLDPLNYDRGVYAFGPVQSKEFARIENWEPKDSAHTRPGFVQVPVWSGEKAGDALDFDFTGTAVALALIAGPDAGIFRYSIDGGAEQNFDPFTKYSRGLHLPEYVLLADRLKQEAHRLHVVIDAEKNEASTGHACRIVHFLVN